jgi:hypothetical protein
LEHLGVASFFPAGWQEQPPQVLESVRQSASPLHAMFDAGALGGVVAGGVVLIVPLGVEPEAGRGGARLPIVPAGAGGGVVEGGVPTGRVLIGVAVMGGCDAGGGDEAGCGTTVGVVAGGVVAGGGGGGDATPGPDDDPASVRTTHAVAKSAIASKEVFRIGSIMRLP